MNCNCACNLCARGREGPLRRLLKSQDWGARKCECLGRPGLFRCELEFTRRNLANQRHHLLRQWCERALRRDCNRERGHEQGLDDRAPGKAHTRRIIANCIERQYGIAMTTCHQIENGRNAVNLPSDIDALANTASWFSTSMRIACGRLGITNGKRGRSLRASGAPMLDGAGSLRFKAGVGAAGRVPARPPLFTDVVVPAAVLLGAGGGDSTTGPIRYKGSAINGVVSICGVCEGL